MAGRRVGVPSRMLVVALITLAFAVLASVPVLAAPLTPVRLGVDSFILGAQMHVAAERGIFKKYGLEPVVQVFSYGADTLDAVLAGRSDFGVGMDFATLTRLATGQLRVVASIMEPDPGFHKLAVRAGINGPQDLKGKSLGVAQGSLQHYVTLRYLEVNHIPDESVKLTSFSSLFEILAALRAGRIDAAWVWGNGVDEALKIEGVRILTDDGAAKNPSVGYLVASRQFAERDPKVVKAVLQALVEASDWMETHMEEASKIVAAKVNAPQERVLTEMKRENYTFTLKASQIEAMVKLANFMVKNGILKAEIPVKQYMDPAPLREVDPKRVAF